MYEKLGRMMGRSYEETVTTLIRSMKSAESQTRLEIMNTLDKVENRQCICNLLLFYCNIEDTLLDGIQCEAIKK